MRQKIVLFLFFCFSGLQNAQAQIPDTLKPSVVLPVAASWAAADVLGNICVIRPDNAVEKYTPDGRLLTRYSDNRSGMAAALDVSNPLKVLVWYADFRVVTFLDRSLTPLGSLNLINAGYPEVRTVALAQDGNLWLYDEVNFRLVKLSPDGQLLYESQPLNQLLQRTVTITCIHEQDGRVWAADPEFGLLEFDAYAQFHRPVNIPGITRFQLLGNDVLWFNEKSIFRLHERAFTPENRPVVLPGNEYTSVLLQPRHLLSLLPDSIILYSTQTVLDKR